MSRLRISDLMKRFPEVGFPGTTVANAKAAMEKWGIRHLPIVDNEKLVGIVSERDLLPHLNNGSQMLRDLMVTSIYKVHEDQYLHRVVFEMAENKYGCTVIVNPKEEIVGIFTAVDALYLLSKLLTKADYSSLRLHQVDWSNADYMI